LCFCITLYFAGYFTAFAQDTLNPSVSSVDPDDLASWLAQIQEWGSRRTGSPAHLACINWISREFESMGLKVYKDEHTFSYYDLPEENVSLTIFNGREPAPVVASAAYPFSGLTDKKGITAPLVFIPGRQYGRAKDKIAVVEVPNKAVPTNALFDVRKEFPEGVAVLPVKIENPVLSSTLFGPDLAAFRKAGALGVIAVWKNMSLGMASGQFVPFTFPYRSIPALWVAGNDGRRLLDAAKAGAPANMILDGSLDTAVKAASIWTMIEGEKSNETILVISHTDGTNPVEENGFVGLLSLAKQILASGKKPGRTVIFAAVAGHLRLPDITRHKKEQATTVWLNEHPELWDDKKNHRKAVAGLVLEHLGAMEWADTKNGYGPTGNPAIEVVYASSPELRNLVYKNWRTRTVPFRSSIVTPRSIRHLGEGEPLYEAGIPAIAVLGIPSYLLSEMKKQGPGISFGQSSELVNTGLVKDQCSAAFNILSDLIVLPSEGFGKVKHVGFFGKVKDLLKVINVMYGKD
jgi:hypothetical protein